MLPSFVHQVATANLRIIISHWPHFFYILFRGISKLAQRAWCPVLFSYLNMVVEMA
jgi:hypothetical protein